jgi:hypothetical protein
MSNIRNFINEAVDKHAVDQANYQPLVETWKPTRLLNGLDKKEATDLAILLQNQANRLKTEASRTSTAAGGEEWHDVALPIVRKVFVEGNAKKLIYTQSIDKPSGVVFYMDFEANDNKPSADNFYDSGESVYGTLDQPSDVTGGFYGADRYSYSMNYYSASANVAESGSATWGDVDFRDGLSASVAAGEFKYFTIPTSSAPTADVLALETHVASVSGVDKVYRSFTSIEDGYFKFVHSGSVVADSASVTLRYTEQPREYDRGDFESGQDGVGLPTELNLNVSQKHIVAKTRWLKSKMTPELIQDLKAYQTLDAQKEVTNMMSQFLMQEEDMEILSMLSNAAPVKRYWSAQIGRFLNSNDGSFDADQPTFTQSPNEWYKTLGIRMNELSYEIQKRTLRGRANWAVVSPKMASLIQSMEQFRSKEDKEGEYTVGLENVGSLGNSIKVYSNPYWKENEILMGFKGTDFLQTGASYLQYIPYMMTPPITSYVDASVHQFIQTRNAKIVTRGEFYGKILVQDLNSY